MNKKSSDKNVSHKEKSSMLTDTTNREIPNTNGVVIWPEKILNEIKMLEHYDKVQKRKEVVMKQEYERKQMENDEFLVEKLGFTEKFELYTLLIVVAFIWWGGTYYVLKRQKFPYHRHYFEAVAIYICPVIFIVCFFIGLDKLYNYYYYKTKDDNKKDV